jgi:hypothetical protein
MFRWGTVVNYVANQIDQGLKCVTNMTEISATQFRYAVTFIDISHKER